MKKITVSMLLFLSGLGGYSQVKGYTFSQSNGNYSAIHEGVALGTETSDAQYFIDPAVAAGTATATGIGIPIGFDFTFNGQVYDRFGISNDGWISLGSSTLTIPINMTVDKVGARPMPLSSVTALANELNTARIAALSADLQAQTGSAIRFLTSGDVGGRVLIVQWENYKRTGANAAGDSFNFQIRLSETTNTVQVVYGNFTTNQLLNEVFQVGLRAEPSNVTSNLVNRTSSSGWDNTTAGVAADKVLMNGTTKPASGLTYTWTPPTCGAAKALLTSIATINSAALTWSSYIPASEGYEYVVSTSATLPTGSGTSTTTPSANVSNLAPATAYNVFVRTYCGSQFTPWVLVGGFKTKCTDTTEYFEDFDTFTATATPQVLPDCWERTGTYGGAGTSRTTNIDGSNRLMLFSASGAANPSKAYAVMPSVSNLQSGNHRLRFKAYCSKTTEKVEIGYYNSAGTFVVGETKDLPMAVANEQEFLVTPGTWQTAVPEAVKNLVFRNSIETLQSIYLDNVIWEPIPQTCAADVKSPIAKQATHNSAVLAWTAGGSETAWQYVVAPTSVTNPYALTGKDVPGTTPTVPLTGLSASTNYKAWIRSKCADGSLGAWIGPVLFTTACTTGTEIFETFDNQTAVPACWRKVGAVGVVATGTSGTPAIPSSPNFLQLTGGHSAAAYTIVALPPLSNTATGNHRLKFKAAAAVANPTATTQLVIGWLSDVTDPGSFTELQSINDLTTTAYKSYEFTFGTLPGSAYLAFKNPGAITNGHVRLDDVKWEPIPTCLDLSAVTVELVNSTSANLSWTPSGTESAWQYVITSGTENNPYSLTPLNVATPTVTGTSVNAAIAALTPNTDYKIWLRSKCVASSTFGNWGEPVLVTTPCTPITYFSANFDSSQNIPNCWAQAGKIGINVAVGTPSGLLLPPSYPNIMSVQSTPTVSAAVAMPGVSNINAGTHKLSFKYQSATAGTKIDVGYLKNKADRASFVSMLAVPLSCTTSFQTASIDFGTDSAPEGVEVLAFKGVGASVYIDDVAWMPANGVAPPVNDDPAGAITLIVGEDFGAKSVIETNAGATASVQPSPGCGGYNGSDVWNSAVVPASGNITFEVNTYSGGLTNTAAAVYSGPTSSLVLVSCNDSGSTAGDNHPKISLSGRTPGEILYLRIWENGGDASGSFYASAYDSAPLGIDAFETNNFAYYPNPVRDILNLSLNQEISNVTVLNLLGQQVINQSANGNQVKVDMSGLSRGAYLVKVISGNQSKTIKVVKE